MATYSATIQLSNGTLTVTRPHPSAEDVDDVIDTLLFSVRDPDNTVTSVGVTVVTDDTATDLGAPAAPPADPADQLPLTDTGQHADTATT